MNDAARAVWCVIVAKDFARAKSRLSGVLSAEQRRALSRAMFERVFAVCIDAGNVAGVVVATDSEAIEALARSTRARTLRDPVDAGLNDVIDRALAHVKSLGARHAVVLMSDLPRMAADDLQQVMAALGEGATVIVPDRDKRGTNVLGLSLDRTWPTSFGRGDSFQAHFDAARACTDRVTVLDVPGLAFDVDTAEDYARLSQ